jgi:hypothetical protein
MDKEIKEIIEEDSEPLPDFSSNLTQALNNVVPRFLSFLPSFLLMEK